MRGPAFPESAEVGTHGAGLGMGDGLAIQPRDPAVDTGQTRVRFAVRKLSDRVYAVLLANAGSFFGTGNSLRRTVALEVTPRLSNTAKNGSTEWGEPKKKGRIEGRAPVVTNYYTCAGRRSHGKLICPTPAHVRAEKLEGWVLGKLERLVMGEFGGTRCALDRIVATLMGEGGLTGEVERIEGELAKVRETVAALTAGIDPANLALLNDRLTQLRLRKEHLEQELAAAKLAGHGRDEGEIRRWAERQLAGLADALDGRRDDETRRVLGSYVDRITLWPSTKRGEMELADDLGPFLCPEKPHDRPEGRSCGHQIAGARWLPLHAMRDAFWQKFRPAA